MPLHLICPACSSSWPAEAGLQDAEARRACAAAMELPASLASLVLPYLGLHAPEKKRLAWPKFTRLVTELVAMVNSGEVTRQRETRPAPLSAWADGLAEVMSMRDAGKLILPLDGHGLLCEIVHRRASQTQRQVEAATRPLHPSHRPAPSREDWEQTRQNGARHIGALLGSITNYQPQDDTHD